MEIRNRKLPKSKAAELSSYPIELAEPYRPLPAPVYLLLPRNEKLVTVKRSFDFFTTKDLERLRAGGSFYFGPIYRRVEPFLEVAREVKKIMSWNKLNATDVLEPSPYEISDSVLRKLGPLWATIPGGIALESYFAVTFVNELCSPIPQEVLESVHDDDLDAYELSLLRSGVFVFLALHLGYLDLAELNRFRLSYFQKETSESFTAELSELRAWVDVCIQSSQVKTLSSVALGAGHSRIAQKLRARLARIQTELSDPNVLFVEAFEDEREVAHVG